MEGGGGKKLIRTNFTQNLSNLEIEKFLVSLFFFFFNSQSLFNSSQEILKFLIRYSIESLFLYFENMLKKKLRNSFVRANIPKRIL